MKSVRIAMAILCSLGFVGCQNETNNTSKPASNASDGHSHPHGAGGHDHSHDDHSHSGHSHAAGPHGGTVVDWGGGKYHVELVVDHEAKQATAYVFGTDEKTPVPINAENIELSIQQPAFQIVLMPQLQENDSAGLSSRFVGTHENLGEKREYSGTLTALVDGTPYSGDFQE